MRLGAAKTGRESVKLLDAFDSRRERLRWKEVHRQRRREADSLSRTRIGDSRNCLTEIVCLSHTRTRVREAMYETKATNCGVSRRTSAPVHFVRLEAQMFGKAAALF